MKIVFKSLFKFYPLFRSLGIVMRIFAPYFVAFFDRRRAAMAFKTRLVWHKNAS